MTRSVLFDTETTGLDPLTGDRVIEFAGLELVNDLPTGVFFHRVIDPQRDIPADASRIHGMTNADVAGKPVFSDIAHELLEFLGDSPLVAHNAAFDFGFLDAEFLRAGLPRLDRSRMVDTLALAKARFPGMPNSLDALCRRFEIDLSARTTHNALLDCKLLAEVYVELTGGRQRGLLLAEDGQEGFSTIVYTRTGPRTPRLVVVSIEEHEAHLAFIARLKDPVWGFSEP
jgi:DNA polymerase-3 subunit epsilon